MSGFESYTVSSLREALVQSGMSEVDAGQIKGKVNLAIALQQKGITADKLDQMFTTTTLQEETVPEVDFSKVELEPTNDMFAPYERKEIIQDNRPTECDLGWHDYVIGLMDQSELDNGYPTVSGLRRAAKQLYGCFTFSGVVDMKITHGLGVDDPGRATCLYEVQVQGMTYRGIGASFIGNTDNKFAIYPEAIAETRAEARALRKLLGLKIVAAEELTEKRGEDVIFNFLKTSSNGEWDENQRISSAQIAVIKTKCTQMSINLDKFININQDGKKFDTVETLPRSVAADLIRELNLYQTNNKESKEIPKDILC